MQKKKCNLIGISIRIADKKKRKKNKKRERGKLHQNVNDLYHMACARAEFLEVKKKQQTGKYKKLENNIINKKKNRDEKNKIFFMVCLRWQ